MEWQPIETAPRDGRQILGAWWSNHEQAWLHGVFMWRESIRMVGLYGWYFVCTERFNKPTLWMPIPHHLKLLEAA